MKAAKVSKPSFEDKIQILEKLAQAPAGEAQQICAEALDLPLIEHESVRVQKDHSKRIEITLTQEQFEKLKLAQDQLARMQFDQKGQFNIADTIETICDYVIGTKDNLPSKNQTNSTLSTNQNRGCHLSAGGSASKMTQGFTDSVAVRNKKAPWKALTPKRRIEVLNNKSCEFKDHKTQKVCRSKFQLEIDHILPRWAGGGNARENLQVLCRAHNQFRYQSG